MVLDEADQMLERGFAESVEEVLDEVFHDSKNCTHHVFAWTVYVLLKVQCFYAYQFRNPEWLPIYPNNNYCTAAMSDFLCETIKHSNLMQWLSLAFREI